MHDNLGWYCDVANAFIRTNKFKQAPEMIVIKIDESGKFGVKI